MTALSTSTSTSTWMCLSTAPPPPGPQAARRIGGQEFSRTGVKDRRTGVQEFRMWAGAHLLGSEPGGAEGEAAEDAAGGGPGSLISICAPGHLASWSPDRLARGHLVTWPPPRCRSLIPGRPGCSSCRPRWRGPSPAWPWTPHVPPAPGRQHQLVSENLTLGH